MRSELPLWELVSAASSLRSTRSSIIADKIIRGRNLASSVPFPDWLCLKASSAPNVGQNRKFRRKLFGGRGFSWENPLGRSLRRRRRRLHNATSDEWRWRNAANLRRLRRPACSRADRGVSLESGKTEWQQK